MKVFSGKRFHKLKFNKRKMLPMKYNMFFLDRLNDVFDCCKLPSEEMAMTIHRVINSDKFLDEQTYLSNAFNQWQDFVVNLDMNKSWVFVCGDKKHGCHDIENGRPCGHAPIAMTLLSSRGTKIA